MKLNLRMSADIPIQHTRSSHRCSAISLQNNVIPADIAQLLALVVAISMFLTPALFIFFDKVLVPRFESSEPQRQRRRQREAVVRG